MHFTNGLKMQSVKVFKVHTCTKKRKKERKEKKTRTKMAMAMITGVVFPTHWLQ
jgi:hypothetical protein